MRSVNLSSPPEQNFGEHSTANVPRIGYLNTNLASTPHTREAFRQGLRDLGYVEGRNVVIEYRDAEGKFERLPALAAELVALKVDVIVAPPTIAAIAAKQATGTLPIVFIGVGDPVASGFVTSLAQPGGNMTGLSISVGPGQNPRPLRLLGQDPSKPFLETTETATKKRASSDPVPNSEDDFDPAELIEDFEYPVCTFCMGIGHVRDENGIHMVKCECCEGRGRAPRDGS